MASCLNVWVLWVDTTVAGISRFHTMFIWNGVEWDPGVHQYSAHISARLVVGWHYKSHSHCWPRWHVHVWLECVDSLSSHCLPPLLSKHPFLQMYPLLLTHTAATVSLIFPSTHQPGCRCSQSLTFICPRILPMKEPRGSVIGLGDHNLCSKSGPATCPQ